MRRLGLLTFLTVLVAAPSSGAETPKCKKPEKKAVYSPLFHGEGGGGFTPDPGHSDYCEEMARQIGEHNEAEDREVRAPSTENARVVPDSSPIDEDLPWTAAPDRRNEPRGPRDVRAIPRRWPGPRRHAEGSPPSTRRSRSSSGGAQGFEDDLRDAPGNAKEYSLWSNLSTPLLLPASGAGDLGMDEASELSRKDYDAHILGADDAAAGTVSTASPGTKGKDFDAAGMKQTDQPFVIDLDLGEDPGDLRDAVASLSQATGFRVDHRFEPRFLGAHQNTASVRGWLKPESLGQVMARKDVVRVEADRAILPASDSLERGMAEVLVGIRISAESSPTESLRVAAARLAEKAGFRLRRTIGYQQIPGTSKMVLIIEGRVQVRNLSRIMSDPAVVKVAPSPGVLNKAKKAENTAPKFDISSFVPKNPLLWVLVPMLGMLLLLKRKLRR